MFIREAKAIADNLVERMQPHCERIEIAGSIRRGCQVVKDIELVAIPKWTVDTGAMQLFDMAQVNLLYQWSTTNLRWIKTGTNETVDWRPKPHGKWWKALLDEGIKLDLFLTTPEQWGIILLIRTGSAEFTRGVMTYTKHRTSYRVEDGALKDSKERVLETFEERDAFDALHLDYIEPCHRTGFQAVKKDGQLVFPPKYATRLMEAVR